MDEFTRKRLVRSDDARDWSAQQLLDDFKEQLDQLPEGSEVRVAIVYWHRPDKEACWVTNHVCCGVTFAELITLWEVAKQKAIELWKD
jgi:hypothetical protein